MALMRCIMVIVLMVLFHIQQPHAEEISYEGYNLIGNGGFEDDLGAWCYNYIGGEIDRDGAKDGTYGILLQSEPSGKKGYTFQLLSVPTRLDSGSVRFDYRTQEADAYGDVVKDFPIRLEVSIAASGVLALESCWHMSLPEPPLTVIGSLPAVDIDTVQDWHEYTAAFDPSLVAAVQKAHDEGQFVFLLITQSAVGTGDREHCLVTSIDNVSVLADGTQQVPQMQGKIAYSGFNDSNNMETLNILDPNTRKAETIWSHPYSNGAVYGGDVVWSPDSTQLAFAATWDAISSVMASDIMTINRDGSGIKKLTGPNPVDPDNNDDPRVTLTGTLHNTSSLSQSITLTVLGGDSFASMVVAPGAAEGFTILNVPVMDDPNFFNQMITMNYTNDECSNGVVFDVPSAPVSNGQVNIKIPFVDYNCYPSGGWLTPNDLTWKYDGSVIYFTMLGFNSIPVNQSGVFAWSYIKPDGHLRGDNLSWSPVDDRYLFTAPDTVGSFRGYMWMAEPDGEPRKLLENNDDLKRPEWLPDGSGFVYIGRVGTYSNDNFYFYDMASEKYQPLTSFGSAYIGDFSISPDGRYVVFEKHERHHPDNPYHSDLWIFDRLNPADLWRLTDSGKCKQPSWSGADVPDAGGFTLEMSVAGQGTVLRDPDRTNYPAGTLVTLTAQGSEGWRFDQWTGNVADNSTATTTITLNNDETVTATFVEGDGSIDGSGGGGNGGGGGGGGCFIETAVEGKTDAITLIQ